MFSVFGLDFFVGTPQSACDAVFAKAKSGKRFYICETGAHGIVESKRDPQALSALKNAAFIMPDGVPLVWLGKLTGNRNVHRVYGPDLMQLLCRHCALSRKPVFLYGTTPAVLEVLKRRLKAEYPGLIISGTHAPPFRELNDQELCEAAALIDSKKPHIVFVGLSTPKQELFMQAIRPLLSAPVLVGVGAAFDFLSGTKKQAPRFLRRLGLEWLFRLLTEPGRLARRYLVVNTLFIYYTAVWLVRDYLFRRRS